MAFKQKTTFKMNASGMRRPFQIWQLQLQCQLGVEDLRQNWEKARFLLCSWVDTVHTDMWEGDKKRVAEIYREQEMEGLRWNDNKSQYCQTIKDSLFKKPNFNDLFFTIKFSISKLPPSKCFKGLHLPHCATSPTCQIEEHSPLWRRQRYFLHHYHPPLSSPLNC